MKHCRSLYLCLQLLFLLIPVSALTQPWPFFGPYRLTSGSNDRNASFENNINAYGLFRFDFEFLIFERHTGMNSNICVSKIRYSGSYDSAFYLTNDQHRNLNPAVSYCNGINMYPAGPVKHAMAVWQSDRFGRWGIFGAVYNHSTGWSSIIAIDTSANENIRPRICCFDSTNYGITYQSGFDVVYAKFNVLSQSIEYQKNLTLSDTLKCSNPYINGSGGPVIVTYERLLPDDRSAVYYRIGSRDSMPQVMNPSDTVAFAGNNRNEGFANLNWGRYAQFASNRSGHYSVYARAIAPLGQQQTIIRPNEYDNFNYVGVDLEITAGYDFTNHVYAYLRRSEVCRLFFFDWDTIPSFSVIVSANAGFDSKISRNVSLLVPDLPCQRFWFVFNAEFLQPGQQSAIYGYYIDNCLTGIEQAGDHNMRTSLSLRNFPNPFNSETLIKYNIIHAGRVVLNVYDLLGRLVMTPVDEFRTPGSYETRIDASSLAGGVYFYKLVSGSFSETKRMVLVK